MQLSIHNMFLKKNVMKLYFMATFLRATRFDPITIAEKNFQFSMFPIQLFQKRLSQSIVDTGTERNCGVQAAQIIYYF